MKIEILEILHKFVSEVCFLYKAILVFIQVFFMNNERFQSWKNLNSPLACSSLF